MSAKPLILEGHPVSFADAMERGMFRGRVEMGKRDDGDTLGIHCDPGLCHHPYWKFRIKGLRCEEIRSRDKKKKAVGMKARRAALKLCQMKYVLVKTSKTRTKDRKTFTRIVASVLVLNDQGTKEFDFATKMKELGHHGKGK